jgi:DNA-directed RNA polymerase specialized sigma24 family protein
MTIATTAPITDSLSDANLLQIVAQRHVDEAAARAAQQIFYTRHVRYLFGVLQRQQRLLTLARMSAEDLAQECFHRAFERAHTFRADDTQDIEQARLRTRAWLGRIANNLLADELNQQNEVSATPYIERVSVEFDDASPPSSPLLRLVREGLSELSDREQDVLRVTALYQRAGELHQRLPNAVAEELATRWQTSSDNVRAIRSRALKKLRSFFAARGTNPGEAP